MTRICRRILCFALVLMMGAALLPGLFAGAFEVSAKADSTTLGIVLKDDVNVREAPSMSGHRLCKAWKGTVCEVLGTENAEGYVWYHIHIQDLEEKFTKWYYAYIRGDFFRYLTDEEAAAYDPSITLPPSGVTYTPKPVVTPTPAPGEEVAPEGTYGTINDWGVNFRVAPSRTVIRQLNKGTQVKVLTIPAKIDRSHWYKVEYEGVVGYIMSVYLTVEYIVPTTPTPPPDPSVPTEVPTATPTPAPGIVTPTPEPEDPDILGYVKTIKGSVNLRASIGGTVITTLAKNMTYPYLLEPVKRGSYMWYFIKVVKNGITYLGYVRGDCVKKVTPGPTATPTAVPTATPTPTPGIITPTPDPSIPTPTPTPEPTVTPSPYEPTGYVTTIMNDVNIRKSPGGDMFTTAKKKGTTYPYYGEPTVKKNVKWYKIYSDDFKTKDHYGYIHGNYVDVSDPSGNTPTPAPVTPTPTPTAAPTLTPTPGGANEAEYTTLRPGSSGTAVQMLVDELIKQGYYTGATTSKYNSKVENAVRDFQRANGLTADGIAGSYTQHALFNTVPIGTADRNNLTMTLYPAEFIDWWTGGIQDLWTRGSNYKVYDVQTGIVFWAHRWAGGNHADIEPLTKEDTKRICDMYGVNSADEIVDSKHWYRRPCLVTIGTRTFACSLYGVPHNYPDGDTIPDNDFKGQMCLWFWRSNNHSSKRLDQDHKNAQINAWENAPNGHIGEIPTNWN